MNGLQRWVMGMLKQHCGEQFKAAMGMSVDDMQAALNNGDKGAMERVRQHGMRLQKEQPQACQQAAMWAQTAFAAPSGAVNTQNNTNPTTNRKDSTENELQ